MAEIMNAIKVGIVRIQNSYEFKSLEGKKEGQRRIEINKI